MPKGNGARRSHVRRVLIWMFIAVLAVGGSLRLERDSNAKGVLLEGSTLVGHDTDGNPCTDEHGTKPDCVPCTSDSTKKCHPSCQNGHEEPKKDCVPCTNKKGDPKDCHPSCQKPNGDPEDPNKCVPCTDKQGHPKDCKPCKGEDKKGNPKPKHCVVSGDQTTDQEGTPTPTE